MLSTLEESLVSAIESGGPMPFDEFIERALYDPDHGFYVTSGRAGGRRGDFVTSVEVGPLFGAVIADWLDERWRAAGEPSEFLVTEVGAGVGTLFRAIVRARPDCFEALTYTLVDRSPAMLVAHQSLPTASWRSAPELPEARQHAVVANELLDNLAFGIAERTHDGWAPVLVGAGASGLELVVGAVDPLLAHLDDLAPAAITGQRVPVATGAKAWLQIATSHADHVLCFDYAAPTAELAARGQAGWLRTYAGHRRGRHPLDDVGRRDITHDVPVDQLPPTTRSSTQAAWLRGHGLDERVAAARTVWAERAAIGDLEAIAARSAVGEAEALTEPDGLGGFLALEWARG